MSEDAIKEVEDLKKLLTELSVVSDLTINVKVTADIETEDCERWILLEHATADEARQKRDLPWEASAGRRYGERIEHEEKRFACVEEAFEWAKNKMTEE
jgi:hypothetical protein